MLAAGRKARGAGLCRARVGPGWGGTTADPVLLYHSFHTSQHPPARLGPPSQSRHIPHAAPLACPPIPPPPRTPPMLHSRLTTLNASTVSAAERWDSEVNYLRQVGASAPPPALP